MARELSLITLYTKEIAALSVVQIALGDASFTGKHATSATSCAP